MEDDLNAGRLDHLVEGVQLGNVRHDEDLEAVGLRLVGVTDSLSLLL